VKRQPRHSRAAPARYTVTDAAARDRTPTEVGDMLTAFRAGHQRGEASARNRFAAAEPAVSREEVPGD
jgi:hypothetical protein